MANEELIIKLLSSDILDAIRLGVTMMEEYIPRENWEYYLIKYSRGEDQIWSYPKWHYRIVDNHIDTWKDDGIWGQLQGTGFKHNYNLTNFSISTLKEAIEELYNNKNNQQ